MSYSIFTHIHTVDLSTPSHFRSWPRAQIRFVLPCATASSVMIDDRRYVFGAASNAIMSPRGKCYCTASLGFTSSTKGKSSLVLCTSQKDSSWLLIAAVTINNIPIQGTQPPAVSIDISQPHRQIFPLSPPPTPYFPRSNLQTSTYQLHHHRHRHHQHYQSDWTIGHISQVPCSYKLFHAYMQYIDRTL